MTSPEHLRSLLAAGIDGDEVALTELVRLTQPVVWHVCLALGSQGEVEDLVQETYLHAIRSLRSYRNEAPVKAWLVAIARNVCADHVRRRSRQVRVLERLRLEPADTTVPESDGAIVNDLVRRVAPDRREAFVLTQISGLRYAEAAQILGCPVGTIRSRVARARDDLLAIVNPAQAEAQ